MKEDQWVSMILDSPVLSKKILRIFMKSQSARNYTQVLDDYFIEYAGRYSDNPDVKKVLEDWLEVVSTNPKKTKGYITDLFRYKTTEQKQKIINGFMGSMHSVSHRLTELNQTRSCESVLKANEYILESVIMLQEYLEPIDEYNLIEYRVTMNEKGVFDFTLILESLSSITKEHLKSLIDDLYNDSIIDSSYKIKNT